MAPSPSKVSKAQVTPKKDSNKAPTKSALNETNLLFLWHCVHNNKGNAVSVETPLFLMLHTDSVHNQPDYKAVAEIMNIHTNTANWRYHQLKSYFESIGIPAGGVKKRSSTDDPAEPQTPKKTPRKTTKKTPKKTPKQGKENGEMEDELKQELKPDLEMEGVVIKKEEEQDFKAEPAVKMECDSDA